MPLITHEDKYYESPNSLGLPGVKKAYVTMLGESNQVGGAMNYALPFKLLGNLASLPGISSFGDATKIIGALSGAAALAKGAYDIFKPDDMPDVDHSEMSKKDLSATPTIPTGAIPNSSVGKTMAGSTFSYPSVGYGMQREHGMLNAKMKAAAAKKAKKLAIAQPKMKGRGLSML